ncbi:MAG TPA: ketol-acid reductoisomerase, partial [Firmicutes bacterium]|nr:ketol-acid reductoisomerase [Bacillota bacterium]
YEGGLERMRYSVSDTAEYGDLTRGPQVIDEQVRENMADILADVQSGEFAREWIVENKVGRPVFNRLRELEKEHSIERVGRELRSMIPWIKKE